MAERLCITCQLRRSWGKNGFNLFWEKFKSMSGSDLYCLVLSYARCPEVDFGFHTLKIHFWISGDPGRHTKPYKHSMHILCFKTIRNQIHHLYWPMEADSFAKMHTCDAPDTFSEWGQVSLKITTPLLYSCPCHLFVTRFFLFLWFINCEEVQYSPSAVSKAYRGSTFKASMLLTEWVYVIITLWIADEAGKDIETLPTTIQRKAVFKIQFEGERYNIYYLFI